MKPFAIVEIANLRDFAAIGHNNRERIFFGDRVSISTQSPNAWHDSRSRSNVYMADTLQDAQAFASALSEHHPGTTWIVVETKYVYRTKVEKYVSNVSRMENGALIPL